MNCADFNGMLYEFLDETLSPELQAAVREHLRDCNRCRLALRQEKAVAQSIGQAMDRATAGLSLRPSTLRNVLQAAEQEAGPIGASAYRETVSPAVLARLWQWLTTIPLRPIGAGVALAGLLLFLGLQAHRRANQSSGPGTNEPLRPAICIIDVPIQTSSHVFRRQNNTVVDAIAPSVAAGHARFTEQNVRPSKPL